MKTVNVSTVMKTMNEAAKRREPGAQWCEENLKPQGNGTECLKPEILCYGVYTLPITERKLTYGYTVEICGIDVYYKVKPQSGGSQGLNDVNYTKHITINTLSKIFNCERLFIKNIRDKNDCYIVNDYKPRLIRIHANTESFINNEGKNVEYVPYHGNLLSTSEMKVYKALKNKYDAYINELNNEIDECEITDDMI